LLTGTKKDTGKRIVAESSKKTQTKEIVEQLEDPEETPEGWSKQFWIFWENKMVDVESHAEGGGPRRAPDGRILGGGDERIPKTLEQRREQEKKENDEEEKMKKKEKEYQEGRRMRKRSK
jgi:hypothetical protein